MAFIEGSEGIYRPIRVLFYTPIYKRALQLCWHASSYKSQIALVTALLKLQQNHQIPSEVTSEDMTDLVFEKCKCWLRECVWEYEVEDFDETDAKPLLSLVWSVNNSNKMREVEFLANMLLNSPEASPPGFRNPKVLSVATEYSKILQERQPQAPKQLGPHEVVLKVVPRVLHGLWVLPPRPLLNMVSQRLSKMSVGVTKAVLDRVSKVLTLMECQATFSRSIRDEMVESILTGIRQVCPRDVLVNRIGSFSAVLLNDIVEVAVKNICEIFQPKGPEDTTDLNSTVEQEPAPDPEPEEDPELAQEPDSFAGLAVSTEVDDAASQEETPEKQQLPARQKECHSGVSHPAAAQARQADPGSSTKDPYALPIMKKRHAPLKTLTPVPSSPPHSLQQACSAIIKENIDETGKILVPGVKSESQLTVLWFRMLKVLNPSRKT